MDAKPWLRHYDPGVPPTLSPYPDTTFLEVLSHMAKQRPQHPVFFFKGAAMSCSKLDQLSADLAAALVAQGVKKGDRVALLLPNCPQSILGQFGVWKAGAIAVPMNPLYVESELEALLNECGAEVAIVLTPFYRKLKSVQPRTKVRVVIATNIKEYLPPVLRILFTLAKEKKEGHRVALAPGDLWLQDLLRRHARSARPDVKVGPEDAALFLFSGGTTGAPKAAVGSHKTLVISGMQLNKWFSVTLKDWDDAIMQVMPLFHVYGNVDVFAAALVGRNPVALVPNPRDLNDLIATVRKVRPAFLPGVPTLFIGLLNHPQVKAGKVDFKSMKLCISGAAPLLAETKKEFEQLTGGHVVEGYGLTEWMAAGIVQPVFGTYKPGSIGLPLPDVDVRIVDTETGKKTLPTGETGEIVVKSPQCMMGYWNRPAETAETIRDGWLYTGDIGYMDQDGYVFIVDRKKDLIKAGGFQVWPREVEEVVATIPAIAEVCAAGVPDPYRGETVKVWVTLQQGQQCTTEEIQAVCRDKLAAYKVPRLVEFCESLPKTMVGKVLRRALVEQDKSKQPGGSNDREGKPA